MNNTTLFKTDGVSFAYDVTPVLQDINLNLQAGKFYGIVGPNGCGKTTLLDLLIGSRVTATGSILLREKPIQTYNRRSLARILALVPQEFDTGFGFTVEEIVLMGRHPYIERFGSPSPADWDAVEKAMSLIGITELRDRYINTLSGGQKQRTIVARALAQNTSVLLFDEATSSLDIKYTLHIFNIGRQLVHKESKTVIAVIHNLNLAAAYCDDIIFMKDRKIQLAGPTAQTLTPETIADIFDVEASVTQDPFNHSLQVSFQYSTEI
jgi:iron complex transport system ATP-binding protein